jgi:hypothetical protein
MILNFLNKLIVFFRSLFSDKYRVIQVEDEPDFVKSKKIYVIGEDDFLAFAIMICPCGCKSKIHLNLLPGKKPTWSIININGIPTLKPSIWRTVGCKSHFFVRDGKIVWA